MRSGRRNEAATPTELVSVVAVVSEGQGASASASASDGASGDELLCHVAVNQIGQHRAGDAALQHAKPGRYVIEESSMAGELLPSGYSYQRWGVAIRQSDGSVMLEPDPAPVKS